MAEIRGITELKGCDAETLEEMLLGRPLTNDEKRLIKESEYDNMCSCEKDSIANYLLDGLREKGIIILSCCSAEGFLQNDEVLETIERYVKRKMVD